MSLSPATRPSISENPWFWLMLFGGMGVLGVIVIGPKHAARQARIERMADTRARVSAAKSAGVPTAQVSKDSPNGEQPYLEDDFQRPPRLNWLLGLLTVLMLVGTAGLVISRRSIIVAAPTPRLTFSNPKYFREFDNSDNPCCWQTDVVAHDIEAILDDMGIKFESMSEDWGTAYSWTRNGSSYSMLLTCTDVDRAEFEVEYFAVSGSGPDFDVLVPRLQQLNASDHPQG